MKFNHLMSMDQSEIQFLVENENCLMTNDIK